MDPKADTKLPLITKLAGHVPDQLPLTGEEVGLLRALHSAAHCVRRGHHVIMQGRNFSGLWLLADGFAMRYKVLTDGKRQVFHMALPGDLLGYPACFFERALYSVVTLTESSVYPLGFDEVRKMFHAHPRLAMALFWTSASETAMYVEQLATVGQRGAYERVAHFVLEMAARLNARGIGDGTSFRMPLTQEQIADVLGLTAQHVNRMLHRLREENLIAVEQAQFRLLDRVALAALADFEESYLAGNAARELGADPVASLFPWHPSTSDAAPPGGDPESPAGRDRAAPRDVPRKQRSTRVSRAAQRRPTDLD